MKPINTPLPDNAPPRYCEDCRHRIAPARLAVLPQACCCVACQARRERARVG